MITLPRLRRVRFLSWLAPCQSALVDDAQFLTSQKSNDDPSCDENNQARGGHIHLSENQERKAALLPAFLLSCHFLWNLFFSCPKWVNFLFCPKMPLITLFKNVTVLKLVTQSTWLINHWVSRGLIRTFASAWLPWRQIIKFNYVSIFYVRV